MDAWRRRSSTPDSAPRARAFRVAHAGIGAVDLAALGYIWVCGVTRRRGRLLTASVAALLVEGAARPSVVATVRSVRCRRSSAIRYLSSSSCCRARAKAAVPILAGTSVAGIVLVVVRSWR